MKPVIYHLAHGISQRGDVTALCCKMQRPVNLAIERWTSRVEAVTCRRCLIKIATRTIQKG